MNPKFPAKSEHCIRRSTELWINNSERSTWVLSLTEAAEKHLLSLLCPGEINPFSPTSDLLLLTLSISWGSDGMLTSSLDSELCSSSQLCFSQPFLWSMMCFAGPLSQACAVLCTHLCWSLVLGLPITVHICPCSSWVLPNLSKSFPAVTLAGWPCKCTHLTLKVFLGLLRATYFKRLLVPSSLHFLCS